MVNSYNPSDCNSNIRTRFLKTNFIFIILNILYYYIILIIFRPRICKADRSRRLSDMQPTTAHRHARNMRPVRTLRTAVCRLLALGPFGDDLLGDGEHPLARTPPANHLRNPDPVDAGTFRYKFLSPRTRFRRMFFKRFSLLTESILKILYTFAT